MPELIPTDAEVDAVGTAWDEAHDALGAIPRWRVFRWKRAWRAAEELWNDYTAKYTLWRDNGRPHRQVGGDDGHRD